MSKELSMQNIADNVFARYPNEDKVFVTSDGQAFLDERFAKNHANSNRQGKKLIVKAFIRSVKEEIQGEETQEGYADKTIKEIEAILKDADETQVLLILEAEEASAKPRKGVLELTDKRLAELSKEEEV